MTRDRRTRFFNGTVAHESLRGQVDATRFAFGTQMQVDVPVADLRLDRSAPGLDRQILFGHPVCLLDADTGFVRDETTRYVGHVTPSALAPFGTPTHRVSARTTLCFSRPDFKTPDPMPLSCGALAPVLETVGQFARIGENRYVPSHHLTPVEKPQPDLSTTAELLRGTPYLWGGNSAMGIDCSGLVQLAAQAAHLPCPGDSDQQLKQLGAEVPPGTPPKRNDLMFWKGHVALLYDASTLIHANAHAMAVALEPLADAMARIAQTDGPVLAHKRL